MTEKLSTLSLFYDGHLSFQYTYLIIGVHIQTLNYFMEYLVPFFSFGTHGFSSHKYKDI